MYLFSGKIIPLESLFQLNMNIVKYNYPYCSSFHITTDQRLQRKHTILMKFADNNKLDNKH